MSETSRGSQVIYIEGRAVECLCELVPIEQVRLDPSNPRVQHHLKRTLGDREPDQETLQKAIQDTNSNWNELYISIREHKGLHEPILIRHDGLIAEGNTRAVAFMRLYNDGKNPEFGHIAANRLPKEVGEREIALLLANYHVAGKANWRAFEKAGHIYRLHHDLKVDLEVIAKKVGMRLNTVKRELWAYEEMTKKLSKFGGSGDLKKYSYYVELYKNKELEDFRNDSNRLEEFATYVAEGKLKGEDVRRLPEVMKNKNAFEVFKRDGMEAASEILKKADVTVASPTLKKIKEITQVLTAIKRPEIELIRNEEEAQELIRSLHIAIAEIAKYARIDLE